jgi:hypothetical protein
MRQDKAFAHQVKRKQGASEEHRAALADFYARQADWKGTCRKCGAKLEGTLREIREHVCGKVPD